MAVKLYGPAGSPYVRAARLALEEKGVAYELIPVAPGTFASPEHLARHPFARVPALEHDGFALYEVQAIVRYVDQAFPGPALQPADPRRAARMNQIMNIVDWYVFHSMTGVIAFQRLVAPRIFGTPPDEAAIAAAVPLARTCARALEDLMGEGRFLTGPGLTLADVLLAPHLDYFRQTPEGVAVLAPHARLCAWWERMAARDTLDRAIPKAA